MIITQDIIIAYLVNFLNVVIPVMLGAYAKELYHITKKEYKRINIQRIIISGVVPAFGLSAFFDKILSKVSYGTLIFLCVVGGMVGMQLFEEMSTLEGIRQLMRDINDFKDFRGKK